MSAGRCVGYLVGCRKEKLASKSDISSPPPSSKRKLLVDREGPVLMELAIDKQGRSLSTRPRPELLSLDSVQSPSNANPHRRQSAPVLHALERTKSVPDSDSQGWFTAAAKSQSSESVFVEQNTGVVHQFVPKRSTATMYCNVCEDKLLFNYWSCQGRSPT